MEIVLNESVIMNEFLRESAINRNRNRNLLRQVESLRFLLECSEEINQFQTQLCVLEMKIAGTKFLLIFEGKTFKGVFVGSAWRDFWSFDKLYTFTSVI